jgi:hypothetical protein
VDSEARTRINVDILRNAVLAVEKLSTNLRFWMLQSGAKVQFLEDIEAEGWID